VGVSIRPDRSKRKQNHKMQTDQLAAFFDIFCHPCRVENLSGFSHVNSESSQGSNVARPELASQQTGLACSKGDNPPISIDDRARKPRRRHASLIDDSGRVICAPMPGWTSEQFAALILALREIPTTPTCDGKAETAYWERMRLVAARVPGKSVDQCSECTRYVTYGGVGVFADIRKKPPCSDIAPIRNYLLNGASVPGDPK
jgi:hypothetical protein